MEFITVELAYDGQPVRIDRHDISLKQVTLTKLGRDGWEFAGVLRQGQPGEHPLILMQRNTSILLALHNPISKYTQEVAA